jgi:hypothetical protein
MSPSAAVRPANLLDQRFAPASGAAPFELQCSMMLAEHGVYLSDLAPEAFIHICDYLRGEAMPEPA